MIFIIVQDAEYTGTGVFTASAFAVFRVRFRSVNGAEGMLGRRVDGIEFERCISRVDDIMPRACGNENGIVVIHTLLFINRDCVLLHKSSATQRNTQKRCAYNEQ